MSVSPPPLKRRRLVDNELKPAATLPMNSSDKERFCVYSWNINGIQPFVQKSITSFFQSKQPSTKQVNTESTTTASLRDFLRRHSWPTVLCLQEVKINPSDEATKSAVRQAAKSTKEGEPDYEAHFCLPTDPHNARGFGRKVYGVCTIIRKSFVSKYHPIIRTVDWDLEGRFQIVEIQEPKLSIWNIYAVNGTDNPYKDSKKGAVIGTRHDRKLAVHKHMLDEAKSLEAQGFSVILAGDMNIARTYLDGHPNLRMSPRQHVINRADFNKNFFDADEGLKAVDTYRHIHGDEKGYTYYPRGRKFGSSCDRVDLIICSRSLEKKIVDAGVCATEKERGPSDHVPLFATFKIEEDDRITASKT